MKSIFFSLIILFSLSFILSCGETDNPAIDKTETYESFESVFPLAENIPLSDYPDGWIKLTDEDVAELMEVEIPPNWFKMDIDPEARTKYTHAQLLKQFGDIPQVRYIIEFGRNPEFEISRELFVAYFEAHYHLFPTENNRRALEEARNIENQPRPEFVDEDKLIEKDPKLFIEIQRERFIKNHGDIPEVHTYLDIQLKFLLDQHVTDDERLAWLKAQFHLFPTKKNRDLLKKYQKAKEDGDE
ncbi:hypothetical protein F4X88_15605 [Candidatus Poribacteria bacterium]|nr:hypothetical protein [Candidatus Poribacteria bacterium]